MPMAYVQIYMQVRDGASEKESISNNVFGNASRIEVINGMQQPYQQPTEMYDWMTFSGLIWSFFLATSRSFILDMGKKNANSIILSVFTPHGLIKGRRRNIRELSVMHGKWLFHQIGESQFKQMMCTIFVSHELRLRRKLDFEKNIIFFASWYFYNPTL